jgi:hypothetical protein
VKPLLMIIAALFLAGCTTVHKHKYIIKVDCRGCAPAVQCKGCTSWSAVRSARCIEGRFRGDFGQVFRVECPGGRVVPELGR